MELTTYNGEHFERSKLRYIIFFVIVVGLGIVWPLLYSNHTSTINSNTSTLVGAALVLLVAGGYFFFQTKISEPITIKIEESWLLIGKKHQTWNELSGFVLEFHTEKKTIHNIVFLTPKGHEIYTINDTQDQLKAFATALGEYLPLLDNYHQTFREQVLRKSKL